MMIMIIGLLVFLGAHSVRIGAERWRQQQIASLGHTVWKAAFFQRYPWLDWPLLSTALGKCALIPPIFGIRQWACAMQ